MLIGTTSTRMFGFPLTYNFDNFSWVAIPKDSEDVTE